jgi:hypothetical protein
MCRLTWACMGFMSIGIGDVRTVRARTSEEATVPGARCPWNTTDAAFGTWRSLWPAVCTAVCSPPVHFRRAGKGCGATLCPARHDVGSSKVRSAAPLLAMETEKRLLQSSSSSLDRSLRSALQVNSLQTFTVCDPLCLEQCLQPPHLSSARWRAFAATSPTTQNS